jgi:hypothetical protein
VKDNRAPKNAFSVLDELLQQNDEDEDVEIVEE